MYRVPSKRHKSTLEREPSAIYDHNVTDSLKAVDFTYNGVVKNRGLLIDPDKRVHCINGLAQGTGPNQRIGTVVELVEVIWDCYLYPTFGIINPLSDVFKFALVYDRQPNGALPTYDEIFKGLDKNGTAIEDPISYQNIDNIDRFFVLRDMKWCLTPVYDEGLGLGIFPNAINVFNTKGRGNMISDKCSLLTLNAIFTGTGSSITNITTGALYIVTDGYFGHIDAPETAWSYNYHTRVFYRDLV